MYSDAGSRPTRVLITASLGDVSIANSLPKLYYCFLFKWVEYACRNEIVQLKVLLYVGATRYTGTKGHTDKCYN